VTIGEGFVLICPISPSIPRFPIILHLQSPFFLGTHFYLPFGKTDCSDLMSEFDRLAMVSASVENEFADTLQVYKQMPDCNLSIVDIFQDQLDVDSASSTPTCLPSTPIFWGTDPSLTTPSKSSSTINGNENDFFDFHWNENDGCPYLWNSINEVFQTSLGACLTSY
jgi:hypothetical protein